MAEMVMMETAVEYRGLYGGFVYRVVIMLDNARYVFSEFYYEYYGIHRNTSF